MALDDGEGGGAPHLVPAEVALSDISSASMVSRGPTSTDFSEIGSADFRSGSASHSATGASGDEQGALEASGVSFASDGTGSAGFSTGGFSNLSGGSGFASSGFSATSSGEGEGGECSPAEGFSPLGHPPFGLPGGASSLGDSMGNLSGADLLTGDLSVGDLRDVAGALPVEVAGSVGGLMSAYQLRNSPEEGTHQPPQFADAAECETLHPPPLPKECQ
jgi:hypothetical protein